MIPQIIYIVLTLINLVMIGYQHNKPKEGRHNAYLSLFAMCLHILLFYWGGFFDPLFN